MCAQDLEEAQEFKAKLCDNVLILKVLKGSKLSLVKYRSTDGANNSSIIQPSC